MRVPDLPPPTDPFDADVAIARLRVAVANHPPAVMFQLADEGRTSVFEQLISCIVSIRTLEEVTLPTCRKLFAAARTPAAVAALSFEQLDALIRACTFHEPKAQQIRDIAGLVLRAYGGVLPCDYDVLTTFRGVGPKCANLAVGVACPSTPHGVPVDIHVHRVTNRWGVVATRTPEKTAVALEKVLPKPYWVEINRLLVPFGKFVCQARSPKCSTCPLVTMCKRVGVTSHQ